MCVCIVIYASTYTCTVKKHGYNMCEKHVGEEREREREREGDRQRERERERERCMAML